MKKLLITMLLAVVMLFTLVGCGGTYYGTYISSSNHHYALEIKGSKATIYTNGNNYETQTDGNAEKTDDGYDLYFNKTRQVNNFSDYCPLHATISADGNSIYLTSDDSDWNSKTFTVVSKGDFDSFIEDHIKITVTASN